MDEDARLLLITNSTGDANVPNEIRLKKADREVSIGRGMNCTVTLGSLQISRNHAKFEYDATLSKWTLRDLSTNGISINSTRIQKNTPTPLTPNDTLILVPTGTLVYKFEAQPLHDSEATSDCESLLSVDDSIQIIESNKRKIPQSKALPLKKKKTEEENSQEIEKLNELELKQLAMQQKLTIEKLKTANQLLTTEKSIVTEEARQRRDMEVVSLTEQFKEELVGRIESLMESEFSCCVCNGVFVKPTTSPCGHSYCTYCISEWLKKKRECPICRTAITSVPKRHVELDNYISKIYDIMGVEYAEKRKKQIEEREREKSLVPQVVLADLQPVNLVQRGTAARRSRRGRNRGQQGLPGGQFGLYPPLAVESNEGIRNLFPFLNPFIGNRDFTDYLMID